MRDLVLVANAGDGTVSSFRITGDALEPLAVSTVGGGCSTFVVDEARDLVLAASKQPSVDTFRLDRATGRLSALASVPVASSMTYLDLAHDGRVLVGASYGGGFAETRLVDEEGRPSDEPVARVEWPQSHCALVAGTGGEAVLYVVSLGADLVAQYALSSDGSLVALDPATAVAPEGSGPRHLTLSRDGKVGWVVTEFSGEVLSFARDRTGALTPSARRAFFPTDAGLTHSRLGADPLAEHLIWGADVHQAGADGQWVLATERTTSTLACLPVLADGSLGERVSRIATPTQPRGFWVLDGGRFAVVAGERDTEVSLVSVDEGGALDEVGRWPTGRGANWVRAV
ncbi:lactonase family protein [Aestuariimicrobium sp. T2.26MG-19.2B]|uniref:lactonase family protein n=1 Tax=Aestuariimicrobium sp. T2.26MG-19.2B TaxID=3040679 RepID=UPI0024775781|nr:beta-propeller fold lactonase family protein [Aestuariimicrobium sp. T2.26MG-19.2B]CAI9407616.1 6-phosphogluconolactonase [Aestuariimicrobium sp. T2.26MG-19.2B]